MTREDNRALADVLRQALSRPGPVVFLTGAGISAESGIPTFRGKEGYWHAGSKNYHPQELATRAAFNRVPETLWAWYLHRARLCYKAQPNRGHLAIVQAEQSLGDRFLLITQNVDGLHARAGNSRDRTYTIHGSLDTVRCARGCGGLRPLPADLLTLELRSPETLSEAERRLLSCEQCGGLVRPHVLWFDESYDEKYYKFESSMEAASRAAALIVVGTTGATSLPMHIGSLAAEQDACMVVINPELNPFFEMAQKVSHGIVLQGTAGHWLPQLAQILSGF